MTIPKRGLRLEMLLLLIIIIFLIVLTGWLCHNNCRFGSKPSSKSDTVRVGSWNILLSKAATSGAATSIISQLEQQLRDSLVAYGYDPAKIIYQPYFCPCDSFLINLTVTVLDESGGSKVPPNPASTLTPSGGSFVSASVQYNTDLSIPEIQNRHQATLDSLTFFNYHDPADGSGTSQKKISIAIIDSGIDSAFAKDNNFSEFIIPNSPGSFSNFLPFADAMNNKDDDIVMKHGSLVTAALLQNQTLSGFRLKIFELKALDANGRGTSFSASCALSYALQQKVNVINASWGYYGEVDSILLHYIGLCNKDSIPVVAAAGNTKGVHNEFMVPFKGPLNYPNPEGLLTQTSASAAANLFYPACFSRTMPYVITVTGLNKDAAPDIKPCNYQNYSPKYVSIGVTNTMTCCTFTLGNTGVEGSSFEAPVVSFLIGATIASRSGAKPGKAIEYLRPVASSNTKLLNYIQDGLFITH